MNTEYKKYMHLEKLGSDEVDGILFGDCYVFPKIDGCFDYQTPILLEDGSTESIGKIVNQKMKVNVLSYNFKEGVIEPKPVTNWFKKPCAKDEWLTISVQRTTGGLRRGGGRSSQLRITKNHHVFTDLNGGTKRADELREGDVVYVAQDKLTMLQEQCILGSLLGDGFMYPNKDGSHINGFRFSHCKDQIPYINHKIKLLGDAYASQRKLKSGYGSEMTEVNTVCDKRVNEIYDLAYVDRKKTVKLDWLNKLNSVGLACWYMDDGSLIKGVSPRVQLSTDGFSFKEQVVIREFLSSRGYDAYIQNNGKGSHCIKMTPEGSIRFFTDISPYMEINMGCKKLPPNFQFKQIEPPDTQSRSVLIPRKITKIEHEKKECYHTQGMDKFDIEVQGNHSYFAKNVLVHNSNAQIWRDEDGIHRFGSRNRELSIESDNAGFMAAMLGGRNFTLPIGAHIFGEWLVPHSLKTYREDAWRKFYCFDVMIDGEYLDFEHMKAFCIERGIEYIPPIRIIKNPKVEDIQKCLDENKYLIQEGKGCGEGVVIKNYEFKNKFGRVCWAKMVTNEFKEKHVKEMGAPKSTGTKHIEEEIVEEFITKSLCEKTFAKIKNDSGWSSKKIPELLNRVYHDLIVEHTWDIVKSRKNPKIDFKVLQGFCFKKIKEHMSEVF